MNLPLKQATQEAKKKKRVWDLLVLAREAITDPARWTKGEYVRDKDGNALLAAVQRKLLLFNCEMRTVEVDAAQADCFCGIGVLKFNANSHQDFNAAWPILVRAASEFKGGNEDRQKAVENKWRLFAETTVDAQPVFFEFNDHHETTHAEVLAVYDAAIATAAKDYADSLPRT